MVVNQIYSFLNTIAPMMWGHDYVDTIDTTGLIDYGNHVLSSSTDIDKFCGALVDRIGKTVIRNLDLDINYPNLMVNDFTFGATLQKISVDPLEASAAGRWDIADVSFVPTLFKIDIPTVHQELFSGIDTWNVDVTIPDKILRTAFTSAEAMGAFIDAIMSAMRDTMVLHINYMNRIAVNTAIAKKINEGDNVIHLLTDYGDATLTPDTALQTPAFLKYMWKQMVDYINYLSEPSVGFNANGRVRATRRDNMHVFLNSQVENAYKAYLESDTFNMEEIRLPLFQRVISWQGAYGNTTPGVTNALPDFQSATTIDNTIDNTTTPATTVTQDYVIAAFFDRQAVFTTIKDLRTSTDRNNRDEYTNFSEKADIGYCVDTDNENGIVFVLD